MIVSTKQQQIAKLAKKPKLVFTSLNHQLDIEWLYEAYRLTRKDGAVGVDGETARDYEQHLDANLQSLLERVKSDAIERLLFVACLFPRAMASCVHLGSPH